MYDYSTFVEDPTKGVSNFFIFGHCDLTIDNITKRVKVAVSHTIVDTSGNQPFMQTSLSDNEIEAVFVDGTICDAEYCEFIGSKPKFYNKHNSRNAKQKQVVKYKFKD